MAVERKRKPLTTTQIVILLAIAAFIWFTAMRARSSVEDSRAKAECEVEVIRRTGQAVDCVYDERFNEWVPR